MQKFGILVFFISTLMLSPTISHIISYHPEGPSLYKTVEDDNSIWPTGFGDSELSGLSSISTEYNPGHYLWQIHPEGYLSNPIIDGNNNIFVTSRGEAGKIHSICDNSKLNWSKQFSNNYISYPVLFHDKYIVFGTSSYLYIINLNGTINKRLPVNSTIYNINCHEDTIYFTTQDYKLHSVYGNGSFSWTSAFNVSFDSCPSIDNETGYIYIGSWKNILSVYPNGTLRWNYSVETFISGSPLIFKDTIIVSSNERYLYCVYTNGTLKWKKIYDPVNANGISASYDRSGNIFFCDWYGNINCISSNGSIKWTFPCGDSLASPTISYDGMIYVGNSNGELYSIYPNGVLRWKKTHSSAIYNSVAIDQNGSVIVALQENNIFSYGPKVPERPSRLRLELLNDGIKLSWTPSKDSGDPPTLRYNIYRKEEVNPFTLICSVNANISVYIDNDVERGNEYLL